MQSSLLLIAALLSLIAAAMAAPIYTSVNNKNSSSDSKIIVSYDPTTSIKPEDASTTKKVAMSPPTLPPVTPPLVSPPCYFKKETTNISLNLGGKKCEGQLRVKTCLGYAHSTALQLVDSENAYIAKYFNHCSPTDFNIRSRRIQFKCADGTEREEKVFLPVASECVVVSESKLE